MAAGAPSSRTPADWPEMGLQAEEGCHWQSGQAQGATRSQGLHPPIEVHFDEVFALVTRINSVSTFLNGELAVEVYVCQPLGYVIVGQEDKVLHLDKVLYGLCQAPCTWNSMLDEKLVEIGFSYRSEHAVYARGKGASWLLVGVYVDVDDLIIIGNDTDEITIFKQ
jgi:hypothetical protein